MKDKIKKEIRLGAYRRFLVGMLMLVFISLTGCSLGGRENQITQLDSKYLSEQEESVPPAKEPQETPASNIESSEAMSDASSNQEHSDKNTLKKKKDSIRVEKSQQTISKKNKKQTSAARKNTSSEKSSGKSKKQDKKKSTSRQSTKTAQDRQGANTTPLPQNRAEDKPAKPTCTISIDCKTILSNKSKLKSTKEAFVPSDGWILKSTSVEIEDGDSVYDILSRVCRKYKIHMEAAYTPAYKSYYVEGINQLYQFDCGDLSGWGFMVNGKSSNYGCSKYIVEAGDVIRWRYTCNVGKDIGDAYFD